MKKIISFLILLAMLLSNGNVVAESTVDTGIWEYCAYLDAFDRPTDKFYISNKEPLIGKFRNGIVSDAPMNAWIIIENGEYIWRLKRMGKRDI